MKTNEVICEITDDEVMQLSGPIPVTVQIRMILNKAGFKFEDDNKLSSIVNLTPIPLGKMTRTRCHDDATTIYKQIL